MKRFISNKIQTFKEILIIKIIENIYSFKNFNRQLFDNEKLKHTKFKLVDYPSLDSYKNIGLIPYSTWDCQALFKIFSKKRVNSKYIGPRNNIFRRKILDYTNEIFNCFKLFDSKNIQKFEKFIKEINLIYEICQKKLEFKLGEYSYIASYGLIDDLIRNFEYKLIINGFLFDQEKIESLITKIYISINDLLNSFDAIVIAESAYIEFSFIRSYCFHNKIDLFCLHPNGTFRKLFPKKMSSESYISEKRKFFLSDNLKINYNSLELISDNYFNNRLKGNACDADSQRAYANKIVSTNVQIRKVLFLHCFRDANNINSLGNSIFKSYIEWIDYTLSKIKKNQDKWWIKSHPMSKFYRDEQLLINQLFKKHNIDFRIFNNCPETIEILRNNMPVFTCNGTIALETLSCGNYSIATGDRVSEQLVKKIKNTIEYDEILSMPLNKCIKILEASKYNISLAKVILMDTKARCDFENLFPVTHLQKSHSYLKKLKLIFSIGEKSYFG